EARDILDCAGSLWMPEDAVRKLAASVTPPAAAAVAINADLQETAMRYLHRAGYQHAGHPGWSVLADVLAPPDGERQLTGLLASTQELVTHKFQCDPGAIAAELSRCHGAGEPVFAVIPPPLPAGEVITELRRTYRTVCFVLLAGETFADETVATSAG